MNIGPSSKYHSDHRSVLSEENDVRMSSENSDERDDVQNHSDVDVSTPRSYREVLIGKS